VHIKQFQFAQLQLSASPVNAETVHEFRMASRYFLVWSIKLSNMLGLGHLPETTFFFREHRPPKLP